MSGEEGRNHQTRILQLLNSLLVAKHYERKEKDEMEGLFVLVCNFSSNMLSLHSKEQNQGLMD